ncbi:MAG: phage tail protein [Gemmatimonadetes bacterium]|nr:phage tail protein [Gemmatimonadota bacterium]
MSSYTPPGVSLSFSHERAPAAFRTGIPVFLGYALPATPRGPEGTPEPEAAFEAAYREEAVEVTSWGHFERTFGPVQAAVAARAGDWPDGYLASAVRGFFRNGGTLCRVVRMRLPPDAVAGAAERHRRALTLALEAADRVDDVDLVCVPDLYRPVPEPGVTPAVTDEAALALQGLVLEHCAKRGDRFAILDAPAEAGTPAVNAWAGELARLRGAADGALYHPWLRIAKEPEARSTTRPDEAEPGTASCPPCGHVAGVFSAMDASVGVHKAPANVALNGVVDLEQAVSPTGHRFVAPEVNCLRAFPGRGIRVWGARTLAGAQAPAWTYVPVRRVFLTVARWLDEFMTRAAFEVNDQALWSRVSREVSAYLGELYRRGALLGATPQDAFYVRCDASTNPPEVVALGQVVADIGLAAGAPNEFIAVRVTHAAGGVTITGPNPA